MSSTSTIAQVPEIRTQQRTLWRDAARSFSRNRLAMTGLVIVAILVICAIFANLLAPQPYYQSNLAENSQFPSWRHLLGTDPIGRDILSRLIYGARTSLLVGFTVQLVA